MRYILIDESKEGMVLGETLYDENDRVLLNSGKELTEPLIEKLRDHGCFGFYIEDELSEGIEIKGVISPQLRAEGMECIKRGDIDACMRVSKAIIDEILANGILTLDMMDLQSYENYTYAHTINVATFSALIGMGKGLARDKLETLVLAALLHDFGKQSVPLEILNKPGKLTDEEFEVIKTHPVISYEMIKDRIDISAEAKAAVLFHHENVDGTGYPRGLEDTKQTFFTKVLHVADVFDALVSRRPYKNPYPPYEACEFLMSKCGIMFDTECVQLLMKYVPLYPKGTEVSLTDGRQGIIYENSGEHNMRPIVRLFDKSFLDLSKRENLHIAIVIPEVENGRSERDKES